MDNEHGRIVAKSPSILRVQEDEFLNKILSRNSSVGCSSRIYHYGSTEGVPFKWEMQPGTPKNPPKEEALPPLSPPPAILSLGLPKPTIHDLPEPEKGSGRRIRFKFWKRSKKTKGCVHGSDKLSSSDGFCSEGEYVASPPRNSSSSSSSSFSFSNSSCMQSSRFHGAKEWSHGPFACGPWNFRGIVISVARRG